MATARNSYPVRPLRVGLRKQTQGFTNGFMFVAVHAEIGCPSVLGRCPNRYKQNECKNCFPLLHVVLLSHLLVSVVRLFCIHTAAIRGQRTGETSFCPDSSPGKS